MSALHLHAGYAGLAFWFLFFCFFLCLSMAWMAGRPLLTPLQNKYPFTLTPPPPKNTHTAFESPDDNFFFGFFFGTSIYFAAEGPMTTNAFCALIFSFIFAFFLPASPDDDRFCAFIFSFLSFFPAIFTSISRQQVPSRQSRCCTLLRF